MAKNESMSCHTWYGHWSWAHDSVLLDGDDVDDDGSDDRGLPVADLDLEVVLSRIRALLHPDLSHIIHPAIGDGNNVFNV